MKYQELAIIDYVEKHPDSSQRELARQLNISLGAVNYCMQAFIEKGWVKVGNFKASNHKMKYMYVLTPKGLKEKMRLTRHFLALKLSEYEALEKEITRLKEVVEGRASAKRG